MKSEHHKKYGSTFICQKCRNKAEKLKTTTSSCLFLYLEEKRKKMVDRFIHKIFADGRPISLAIDCQSLTV